MESASEPLPRSTTPLESRGRSWCTARASGTGQGLGQPRQPPAAAIWAPAERPFSACAERKSFASPSTPAALPCPATTGSRESVGRLTSVNRNVTLYGENPKHHAPWSSPAVSERRCERCPTRDRGQAEKDAGLPAGHGKPGRVARAGHLAGASSDRGPTRLLEPPCHPKLAPDFLH